MRPLKGIVVKVGWGIVRKGYMSIELESGNTITTKRIKNIKRGNKVEVAYDFTHNRVRDVWLEGQKPGVSTPDKPHNIPEEFELPDKETVVEDVGKQPSFDPELEEWQNEQERLELGALSFPKSEVKE